MPVGRRYALTTLSTIKIETYMFLGEGDSMYVGTRVKHFTTSVTQ